MPLLQSTRSREKRTVKYTQWRKSRSLQVKTNPFKTLLTKSEFLHQSRIPISSDIRTQYTIRHQDHFSWSLSLLQEEISLDSSKITRKESSTFLKVRFGEWQFRCSMGLEFSTEWISSIEISKVLIFYSPKIRIKSNLATLMSAKSVKVVLLTLKLGHRIMPALKYGQTYHIMANVTFGLWVVFFIKWLHLDLLLWHMIFKDSGKRSLLDISREFLHFILKNYKIWSDYALLSIQEIDLVLRDYFTTIWLERDFTFILMSTSTRQTTNKLTRKTD